MKQSENSNTKDGYYFNSSFHQLSHDIRTPLNHINGFAELLLMDPRLSQENADHVRAILSGSARLHAVVKMYLDGAEALAAAPPTPEHTSDDSACAGAVAPPSHAFVGTAAVMPDVVEAPSTRLKSRSESVIGPLGQPMTRGSLPSRVTRRWNAHRKAELVATVHGGLLTIEEVCERYRIELEEFVSWQRGLDRLGSRGLWVMHSKKHRDLFARKQRY